MVSEPRILFLRLAPKPYANRRVVEALSRCFPGHIIDVIDIRSELRRHPLNVGATWMEAIWKGGSRVLKSRQALRLALDRTRSAQEWVKTFVAQQVRDNPYEFTFQMQSLFDGSSERLSHFVYTDHAMLENLNYPGHERWAPVQQAFLEQERAIYKNAKKIFIRSANIARCLTEQYDIPQDKLRCVRAGPNVEPIRYSPQREYDGQTILFVGMEWERKGGPTLVEAFRQVRAQSPNARLIIVGCSPRVSGPGIEIHGKQPLQALSKYYEQASLFCLPSLREPFGISYVEAMTAGLPVVATSLGAAPEIVRNRETGILVPAGNPDALATALLELVGHRDRCASMGSSARRIAEKEYSWSAVADNMAEVIHQLI